MDKVKSCQYCEYCRVTSHLFNQKCLLIILPSLSNKLSYTLLLVINKNRILDIRERTYIKTYPLGTRSYIVDIVDVCTYIIIITNNNYKFTALYIFALPAWLFVELSTLMSRKSRIFHIFDKNEPR